MKSQVPESQPAHPPVSPQVPDFGTQPLKGTPSDDTSAVQVAACGQSLSMLHVPAQKSPPAY
jgi:hypothetical protein